MVAATRPPHHPLVCNFFQRGFQLFAPSVAAKSSNSVNLIRRFQLATSVVASPNAVGILVVVDCNKLVIHDTPLCRRRSTSHSLVATKMSASSSFYPTGCSPLRHRHLCCSSMIRYHNIALSDCSKINVQLQCHCPVVPTPLNVGRRGLHLCRVSKMAGRGRYGLSVGVGLPLQLPVMDEKRGTRGHGHGGRLQREYLRTMCATWTRSIGERHGRLMCALHRSSTTSDGA